VYINLFIVHSLAYLLVLGNLFIVEGRASFKYNKDRNIYCKLKLTNKTYLIRFRAAEDST
jgi:hypothetical protein